MQTWFYVLVSLPYQSVTSYLSNAGKVDRSAWLSAFSGSDSARIDKVVKTILTPVSIALGDSLPNMLRSVTFLADDRGIQANHNVLVSWPIGGHCAFQNDELCTKSEHFRKTGIDGATIMYAPLFETECSYIEANLKEFLDWTAKDGESVVGPFSGYHSKEFWAYADYKYIAQLFQDKPAMFQDVVWSDFGFPGRDGRDSTIWIGTQGANTPCHLDSYGCNLVFQIQGRKRWHLFPPDDTPCLYPTRIPYEESSVFSRVSVVQPELEKFPAFKRARVHTVTLQPGQVLFVPRHWWHYVESLDQVTISVNSWIEMDIDDEARVEEALTKTLVCAMKSVPSLDNEDHWLNPTEEEVSSHDENMHYLNLAVKAYMNKRRDRTEDQCLLPEQHTAGKRDSSGLLKTPMPDLSFVVPFGPHLIPVNCAEKPCPKDTSVSQSTQPRLKCKGELGGDCELNQSSGLHGQKTENSRTSNGPENDVRISTNDMLECLVHPDVITLITRLIVRRQTELNS